MKQRLCEVCESRRQDEFQTDERGNDSCRGCEQLDEGACGVTLSRHVEIQRRDQSDRISVCVGVAMLNQTSLVEYEEVGKSK